MNRSPQPLMTALTLLVLGLALPLLAAGDAVAQDRSDLECGTVLSPATREILLQRTIDPGYSQPLPANGSTFCMPIAIHVVRDSGGNGGISQAQLDQGLIDVNTHQLYMNTGMSFYYLPDIDYIDNDTYFSIDSNAESDALRGINRVANAINVYFVPEFPDACGRASFSPDAVQGVVMNNDCTGVADNPTTFPHELGHYFDLLHTHETSNGVELVDGSNCGSAGDLLCDTPADPRLTDKVDASCNYTGTDTDPNGDSYNPDTSQLMSYSRKLCRVNVTPQGEARALVSMLIARANLLNCPPEADCGGPYVAECTSCTTTEVMLDGTGSYDPEGEDLTYLWSGAPFDDPTSATPVGTFPLGDTEVTLLVSDGMGETECTVTVTVQDTTPPDITCPLPITVECSATGGVPAGELAAFLADVTATDICDCDVDIENDAPDFFQGPCEGGGGVTTVTWTATDDSGNTSSCSADVTVVDTTPPEFDTLVLNRDVLWPPNHKMSEIVATIEVSDICDDDPVVTLVSIASNEPDNSNGDGNTDADIQEAAFGTDDRMFLLRSERRGGGDGRIYTITYAVTDCSGNVTTAELVVRVPHSQGTEALAYSGYNMDGTLLLPTMDWTRIVIPAVAGGGSGRLNTRGFTAGQVLDDKILLGNAYDVVAPSAIELTDVTKDGTNDILLTFPASAVRKILGTELEYGSVGVQFRTGESGGDRIVKDVFALGAPLLWTDFLDPTEKVDDTPRNRSLTAAPNPFNPQTVLEFGLEKPERVRLRVYNLRGQLVREIEDATLSAGFHSYAWTGVNQSGGRVASGFYMIRLERESGSELKKVMLLK